MKVWPRSDARLRTIQERQTGLTMVAVVILTVVLVSITGGLMTLGLSRHREFEMESHRLRALNAAEAGLATVMDRIWREYRAENEDERVALVDTFDGKYSEASRISFSDVSFGQGIYDASVTEVIRDGIDHADVRVLATGRSGDHRRSITAVIRFGRKPSHVFNYAYFVNNYGWLWGSGIRVNGDVCSNGNFSTRDATVNGDIYAAKNEALGSLGTATGTSRVDSLDWYHTNTGTRSRPTNPTCALTEGEDANGNGVPDIYEYEVGFDGKSDRFTEQTPTEMPYLGKLETYEALASRKCGKLRKAGVLVVDAVYDGTLVIEGTPEEPIVLDGPIVVRGDVVLKGVISGQGTIYAGRNVHVAGNLTYDKPPAWNKPGTDPASDAAANAEADLVGLVARGSVIFGDYTTSTWKSYVTPYIRPSFTQSYVVPATDADIGYVTGTSGGEPIFHGNYTALDGGKKQDGTDRRFYESSLSNADFHAFANGTVERIDGIFYTNHLFSGHIGRSEFNGTIVARDEAILFTTSVIMNYDVRIHSDGYESIDIYLPRAPMRRFLLWREGT